MNTPIRILSGFALLIAIIMIQSCATNKNVIHLADFQRSEKTDQIKIEKIHIVKVIDISKKREYKIRENSFFPYLNTVPEISLTKF